MRSSDVTGDIVFRLGSRLPSTDVSGDVVGCLWLCGMQLSDVTGDVGACLW